MKRTTAHHRKSGGRHLLLVIILCLGFLTNPAWGETLMGDVDGNGSIGLADAITALRVLVETNVTSAQNAADVNSDNRIGIEELVYVLWRITANGEKDHIEDAMNFVTLSLSDTEKDVEDLGRMAEVLSLTGLDQGGSGSRSSARDIVSDLLSLLFPCGDIERGASNAVIFTFTGTEACGGITGTLKATPTVSDGAISYYLEYEDISNGECAISGSAIMATSFEGGQVTTNYTISDMSICDQSFEGSVAITYDSSEHAFSITADSQDTYTIGDTKATVTTNFSYDPQGGVSGTAVVDTGDQVYNCELNSVQTDPNSGLPVSGTLTINGIEVDFSNTSAENPLATITVDGMSFDVSLEDALDGSVPTASESSRARAALRTVDACTTLLNEFKQNAIEEMEKRVTQNLADAIEWGGCPRWYIYADACDDMNGGALPTTASPPEINSPVAEGGSEADGASEYSETNTQVEGVDEADFIKNDGSYIYILADGKFQIVDAWPPGESKVISMFDIEGEPKRMFVHNDRAFIYSSLEAVGTGGYDPHGYSYGGWGGDCTYGYNCEFTGDGRALKITVLDISDTAAPLLLRESYFSGAYLNSRRIGGAVHTVLVFPEPWIAGIEYWPEELESCWGYDYYWWGYEETPTYTEEELITMFDALKQQNKELILESDISDWLPSVRDILYTDGVPQESEGLLGECDDFYMSEQKEGKNFLAMMSTDISGTDLLNVSSLVGKPGAVYASSSAFYISAKQQQSSGRGWFFDDWESISEASTIHKFALNNDPPSSQYIGSGVVKGRVLNQFSMDEHEGFFRMATTTGHVPSPSVHSTISILEDKGGELEVVGQIDKIAPTEDIRSARFDGNRGFIVTFKKTDPLFVFDLSNPYEPVIAGELKIPGFSTYMHRMDADHLLTIGYDTEDYGSYALFQGIMLQIFDVSDMNNPTLTHKEIIGTRGSTSDAATNHLAFNFFRPKELLAIPMVICEGEGGSRYGSVMTFSGLMVYKVTTDAGFDYLGGVAHEEAETEDTYRNACSNWWTNSDSKVKRSVFMDDYVFSVTEDDIRVNLVSELGTDIAVVNLAEEQ